MPEKEPQFGEKYVTWEETARKLREQGAEKEDIEAAFSVMQAINYFDRKIFPDKPAAFGFVSPKTENPLGHCAGFRLPENGEEGGDDRLYDIWIKDFAIFLNKEMGKPVPIFGPGGRLRWENPERPKLLVAAHEVRHRVQRDRKIKQFSPEDAKLVKDKLLRNIIEFCKILFEEEEKIYRRDGKSEEFINAKLNSREFDARVIERFVANIIHKKLARPSSKLEPQDLDEIVSIIQMAVPEAK